MAKFFEGTDEQWDELEAPHDFSGAVLQSSAWSRVQEARGNVVARIVDADGAPSLWVLLPIALLIRVWYCPKGPCTMPVADEWKSITQLLQHRAHASVLRIEPPNKFSLQHGTLNFKRRRDISPAHSFITDIGMEQDELFKTFHEKTRYNIRVAAKHGVVARRLTREEAERRADEILALFADTGGRHGIVATPAADMRALFSACDVWIAVHSGRTVAAALLIGFGSTMTYLHGASDYASRAYMAPYALHWAAMQDAARRGFKKYDWWGISPEAAQETHRLAGVTRFKLGFGGTRVASPGTFDAGIDRVRFALYTLVRRIKRP